MPELLAQWREAVLAVGVLAGTGTGFFFAEEDPAWRLHLLLSCDGGNLDDCRTNTATNWDEARRLIYNQIDLQSDNSVRCRYSGTRVTLEGAEGHMRPRTQDGVQVEHTWASKAEWTDEHFERSSLQGADLHNLFPVRRGINGSRSDHAFAELPPDAEEYRIDPDGTLEDEPGTGRRTGSFKGKNAAGQSVFEPRANHKGDVARAMFYMSVRYWWPIPPDMEADLRAWHDADPPNHLDRGRNGRIKQAQGNLNPFIERPQYVDEITDF